MGWIALTFFINTVIFDVGDMEGDRAEGVTTLPLVLGFEGTRTMLHAVNVAAALLMAGAAIWGLLPPAAHVVNLLSAYLLGVLNVMRPGDDLGFLCDVVVDGMYLVAGLLAWFAFQALSSGLL